MRINTYKPDLIINDHSNNIYYIKQLSEGFLASCSDDKTVKIFSINGNSYYLKQSLEHQDSVKKIIELENKQLISCGFDSHILFFLKEKNEYKKCNEISVNGCCYSVVQTKNDEICYSESSKKSICFYNLNKKKTIYSVNNIIESAYYWFEKMIMIKKDLLLIGGKKLYLVNVNKYNLIKIIDIADAGRIVDSICLLNDKFLLTGGRGKIVQWRIDGEDLVVFSKKERIHSGCIADLLNLGDGRIASSGEYDKLIKIWS